MRSSPPMPGEGARERRLAEMIRVDHAGEYGAVQIYRGQRAVFGRSESKSHAARIIADMESGEQEHLQTFDRLIAERGVRPTIMAPLWRVAGFGLGAVTALMGEKAAHACTEAVEDVIEEHYARQSAALDGVDDELKDVVDRFREDEMGHRNTAVEQGARDAPGYPVLSAVIKLGCRAAIRISEKI
ncbi:MAG TPA: demethoxyubiquinone hydroxylase family protein [Vitreimonas sp.]|uniref:demethoxyubiquinone hydroxylase family protein n=1 Tax=Vitreimonas sp. TaxID=3069702 RepID=UPI002D45E627|nr:demethoxyubiquinone hydroxylase family protein [Vitreimonas sp.]HYD87527.1 demethoxyubiquinone hydroxylase family protein [Vitreimonas sp.]